MKICVAQPIFAPDEYMLEKNLTSIRSLKNLISDKVDFYFSGWAREEYWEKYDEVINPLNPKKYMKQDQNYGKAYNVNQLTLDLEGYDVLLTMDSDIIFLDRYGYLKNIESLSKIKNLGVISFSQLKGNCHMIDRLKEEIKIDGHRLIWHRDAGGIAGGCLLINFPFWKDINGYRQMGVYAGDDAYIFLDAKKESKFFAMDNDTAIIHPFESNGEYGKWKVKVCQRDSHGKTKTDLEKQVKESMDFWDNTDVNN